MSWQNYVHKNTNIEGARAAFEIDCATLFRAIYPDKEVRVVKTMGGDGGIDVFVGCIGIEPITVIQCKFFLYDFGEVQHKQIRNSFKTAFESTDYELKDWILCIPGTLDLYQNLWWSKWVQKTITKHSLTTNSIILKDGNTLIDLFKEHNLYDQVFQVEELLKLAKIETKIDRALDSTTITFELAQSEIKRACFYLENVTNVFGENLETHIEREETNKIYEWITKELSVNEKNVFILEGEKGYGKTVVLKDLLSKLQEEKIDVLGIKADKYYAADRIQLEIKIFQKENIHIDKIAQLYNEHGKTLVIVVDQLDALSQTLSSNREYIQTYNRLIADLSYYPNIRIVISTRSYDLNYDAEISIYKSSNYSKIKLGAISDEKVKEVLSKYGITNTSEKLIELLSVPNHLDIFCKLPDKRNLDTLTTLKDLYDALWKQLITVKYDLDLKLTLYMIADRMYQEQRIIAANYFDEKHKEINYLKSNHLLIESDKELQFFHQTFYDYTFSRQFVENNKSLEKYINENKQSLYVRAVIKMVIEYYREYNHAEYARLIQVLIKSSHYRFHIKTLVITSLGGVKNPSEQEKILVWDFVLPNFRYAEIFIGSVFSNGWLDFLLRKDFPLHYLTYSKSWKHRLYEKLIDKKIIKPSYTTLYDYNLQSRVRLNLILRLFINNVKDAIDTILDYLEKMPYFPNKHNFMIRFLTNIETWDNERLLPLFDAYLVFDESDNKNDNFWFYHMLEKIFIYYPDFVFEKTSPLILKCFNENSISINFRHEQKSLFEKMNEINPEKSFDFFFELFNTIIEENKYSGVYGDIGSSLYKNFKFSSWNGDEIHNFANVFIENLLTKYIKSKVSDKKYFLAFYEAHKDSDSVSLLKILTLGLSEVPLAYKNEVLEFLNILYSKKCFNANDDTLQLYLRNLISKSFAMFSSKERNKMVEILLSIKHPADVYYHTHEDIGRKVYLNFYGKKKYIFLDTLPKNERNAIPILKKTHQELERKFGKLNVTQLDENRMSWYTVGPPLSAKAYKKMKSSDWKNTIQKYGDEYSGDRMRHSSKGGKLEHSRAFEAEVSENPDKFYPLLVALLHDENVSHDYLASGIDGLIKAEYDVDKVKGLFLAFIDKNLNTLNTLYAIRYVGYFIKHKTVDINIMHYLCDLAINHVNPDKIETSIDPLTDSLNSVRGAAIHKIPLCYYDSDFKEIIFNTLEQVVNDKHLSIKVALLYNLAILNNLDLNRSFQMFLLLTDTDEVIQLRNAFNAAGYFRHKFYDEMKPYFTKIIKNESLHKEGSVLIVLNWLAGYDKDKCYYKQLVAKSKTAKLEALRTAEANVFKKKEINEKCLAIFYEFLNESDEDFAHSYSTFVLRKFKVSHFKKLLPFMKQYASSNLFRSDPRYFLQYLLKCTKKYPVECLELLKRMNFARVPNIQQRGHYDSEPVQLVLSIYSSLNNNFKDNEKEIEKALTIFDEMLKVEHLRFSSNKAIDTLK